MQFCDMFANEPMEKRIAAARLIALARKKMNSGGRHWIQGAYHKMKKLALNRPPESCYCMVGGLNAAGRELAEGRVKGDLALAKKMVASVITGREVKSVRGSGGWMSHTRGATDIIIQKNDSGFTRWMHVEAFLKDAASALRKKPRV